MKKILLVSAALAVFAGQAMANSIYVAGKVGGSNGEANSIDVKERYTTTPSLFTPIESDFTDNVVAWGGAVGYKYTNWIVPLRMEAEYIYRNHYGYDTGIVGYNSSQLAFNSVVDTQTLLANFYMDVPVTNMFAVFFGGGLGEAINTSHSKVTGTAASSNLRGKIDNYDFSWMTTAGITVTPLKWLNFDLSYRYSDLGDISMRAGNTASVGEMQTTSFAGQELFLGIRIDVPNMYKKPHHKKATHKYMDK